jgi:hypothetical protein
MSARWLNPLPDPKPQLTEDSALWVRLLDLAGAIDGPDPMGTYGVLSGLRAMGARLVLSDKGNLFLTQGAIPNEVADGYGWLDARNRWLVPRKAEIVPLLKQLERHL